MRVQGWGDGTEETAQNNPTKELGIRTSKQQGKCALVFFAGVNPQLAKPLAQNAASPGLWARGVVCQVSGIPITYNPRRYKEGTVNGPAVPCTRTCTAKCFHI